VLGASSDSPTRIDSSKPGRSPISAGILNRSGTRRFAAAAYFIKKIIFYSIKKEKKKKTKKSVWRTPHDALQLYAS